MAFAFVSCASTAATAVCLCGWRRAYLLARARSFLDVDLSLALTLNFVCGRALCVQHSPTAAGSTNFIRVAGGERIDLKDAQLWLEKEINTNALENYFVSRNVDPSEKGFRLRLLLD